MPIAGLFANTQSLIRRQNDIAQSLLDQDRERFIVTSSFGEPQTFRLTPKAKTEIREPPQHLRQTIALIAQRQDCVAVRLGDGVTMTAAEANAFFVGIDY